MIVDVLELLIIFTIMLSIEFFAMSNLTKRKLNQNVFRMISIFSSVLTLICFYLYSSSIR